ncbi:MAG: iron ABC transporter permease [Desulfurococcaceae archaeon]
MDAGGLRTRFFTTALLSLALSFAPLAITSIADALSHVSGPLHVYRMYRALYASASGATLSMAGAIMQASLRNPLVDHYVLGIGSGALLASYSIVIAMGYDAAMVVAAAVLGGLAALALTSFIAGRLSGTDVAFVLSGIAVNSLLSGLSIALSYYAVVKYSYASLLLLGTFAAARPSLLPYSSIPLALLVAGYALFARRLNALMVGDDFSAQLGVNPRATRLAAVLLAGSAASVVVGLFGIIGFLGLVVPHLARLVLGISDNRLVIPLAGGIGALASWSADAVGRLIASPTVGELPAGALISAVGAPIFVALLLRRFRGAAR